MKKLQKLLNNTCWKVKARKKSIEIKKLNKRNKELEISRDKWKKKADERNIQIEKLEQQNQEIEKELKKKLKPLSKNSKPKGHKFSNILIQMLIIIKLETSISFRALDKEMKILHEFIYVLDETPCNTTISNWILKLGYYELTKVKIKSDDWIILLDHSIQVGDQKILVIYGIRQSEMKFDRALQYKDLTILAIVSKTKWTGQDVADEIKKVENEIGKIIYAIADFGSNLKKGLKICGIKHIHDITHWMAIEVERLYKNDEQYKSFCAKMSELRTKFLQTDMAHIVSPKQRKKSFYQNIKSISDWAMKSLNFLDSENEKSKTYIKERENLIWLKDYQTFIYELDRINQTICEIEKIVKTKGLSSETIKTCNSILNLSQLNTSEKGQKLKTKMLNYMTQTLQLVPQKAALLCTTDILESAFGKYKNYVNSNPMACVTNLILCLAAFTCSLEEQEIVAALESVKMNDIKKWIKDNIGDSVLKKRTIMLLSA